MEAQKSAPSLFRDVISCRSGLAATLCELNAKGAIVSTGNSNLLLSSLSPHGRDRLLSQASHLPLPLRMSLYEAEKIPSHAYLPPSGIASVVTAMKNGSTA